MGNLEKDPSIYCQLIFDKGAKPVFNRERIIFPKTTAGETDYLYIK